MSKWICGNCGDPCLFNSKDGTDYPTACPLGVVNVKWEPADEFASDYICDFCPAESDNCGKYCETGKCKEAWLTWLKVDTAETQAIAAVPEMYRVLSGICFEKSARICDYAPESCKVCAINKALKKARGEE